MIPDFPNLSAPPMAAEFLRPNHRPKAALVDYARGGVALLDSSQGLNVKTWTCEARGDGVFLSAPAVQEFRIETIPEDPLWVSLAFDQNMHYNCVYILEELGAFFYYYDAAGERYNVLEVGDVQTPIIRMDDVLLPALGDCELILSYIREKQLCVRLQRERFGVEHVLADGVGDVILQCGMNTRRRFQWDVE